jgi:hypothetical protein
MTFKRTSVRWTFAIFCCAIASFAMADEDAPMNPPVAAAGATSPVETGPESTAKEAFERYRTLRFDEYAKLMIQADLEAFRDYAVDLWDLSADEGSVDRVKAMLEVDTRDELLASEPSEVFARFMRNGLKARGGAVEALAEAKFEHLGTVRENDDAAYVVTVGEPREVTLYPCMRDAAGEWKLVLTGDLRGRMKMIHRMLDWKKENKTIPEMRKLSVGEVTDAKLLGLVREDGETIHAVVRAVTRIPGLGIEENAVSIYTIEREDPVWDALDPKDRDSVADDSRREAIESAMLKAWNSAAAARQVD